MGRTIERKSRFTVRLLLATALAMASVACTKKKELKSTVAPDAYISKSDLEGKTFSLVRGVEDADSNNTLGVIPGTSVNYGQVKVRITESEVQFLQIFDPQSRKDTEKILVSYPIKGHFDIARERNDFGEQTNKVGENTERSWEQRAFMRVDWGSPSNFLGKIGVTHAGVSSTAEENTVVLEGLKMRVAI